MTTPASSIQIPIRIPRNLPSEYANEILNIELPEGLSLFPVRYDPTPYQSLDLLIPTLIEIYLGKELLAQIFKASGDFGLDLFKKWLIQTILSSLKIKSKVVTSAGEKKSEHSQSNDISFIIDLPGVDQPAKLFVDKRLSEEATMQAYSQFIDLLKDHYTHDPKDTLELKPLTEKSSQLYQYVLAIVNPETGEVKYITAEEILQDKIKKR